MFWTQEAILVGRQRWRGFSVCVVVSCKAQRGVCFLGAAAACVRAARAPPPPRSLRFALESRFQAVTAGDSCGAAVVWQASRSAFERL